MAALQLQWKLLQIDLCRISEELLATVYFSGLLNDFLKIL